MIRGPFISVCIPAYRRANFLKRLLDSLVIQTFTDFEIVLTDDSPDNEVLELVRSHSLFQQIQYFKNPVSLGTPENWNEGMRRAKGEWIKIMHDDDWFAGPESLERFAKSATRTNAHFIYCAYLNILPDGRKKIPFSPGRYASKIKRMPEVLLASNCIGPPSVVLFRAKPALEFDNRMKWLVDIDFYIRFLKTSSPPVFLPEQLVYIGISESQVTQSSFGNPVVEIPERMLLAEKIGYDSVSNLIVYDSWWRFLRNMHIRSETDFKNYGHLIPLPRFLLAMIRFQKRIPVTLLKAGINSKFLMVINFVAEMLKK